MRKSSSPFVAELHEQFVDSISRHPDKKARIGKRISAILRNPYDIRYGTRLERKYEGVRAARFQFSGEAHLRSSLSSRGLLAEPEYVLGRDAQVAI